ncbi:hypothetical protein [Noviherbaspirillum aerium]|uniref:hypothetical protein n=1 Tax=Noviherbaspirillum aerium TaxID=2588497 RepID=UPI00124E14F2|nr:hypothetical protein [Noviherbaspirillum aerium]
MVSRIVKTGLVVIALVATLLVGWLSYLFGEEDYYPKPGTPSFYLKLSSLIRNIPLAYASSLPAYRGSVGDGPKPPQSSVCYAAQSSKEVWIITSIRTYLQRNGYTFNSLETDSSMTLFAENKPLHYTGYVNEGGQSVDLLINASSSPQEINVCITHYE